MTEINGCVYTITWHKISLCTDKTVQFILLLSLSPGHNGPMTQRRDMKFGQFAVHLWLSFDSCTIFRALWRCCVELYDFLSWDCLTTVVQLSCEKHIVRGYQQKPFLITQSYNCHTTVVRQYHDCSKALMIQSHDCLMNTKFRSMLTQHWLSVVQQWYNVMQHIFVLFRRKQFGGNESLEKHTVCHFKRMAIPP